MAESLKEQVLTGLLWSYMERFGTQLVSFVVSVILARLLMPSDFGVVAIVMVFISFSNVFVHGGFGNALVQRKTIDEYDLSSVFWLSMGVSLLFYAVLFFAAPWVAAFYEMPLLCHLLQVLGLCLPLTAFNVVQRAIVSRSMRFKTYFYSSLTGVVISAVVGVTMAYAGMGVWALVTQQMVNIVVSTMVVACFIKWHPRWILNVDRLNGLFSYGWKLLVGSLIDTFYGEFRSLYVGKLYSPAILAYYTKGQSFPTMVVQNVNSSIMAVLFPALSKRQDNTAAVRQMVRRAIRTSSFVILPLMAGLIAIAKPLVMVLLTEKWLPSVVFVQILCLGTALEPIQTANLQAIYAIGRSDIGLKLNVIKKSVGFVVILTTATISVEAMAWGGVAYAVFASVMNSCPNKKLLGYGYNSQMKDILPFAGISSVMGILVYALGLLPVDNVYLLLILQVMAGGIVYIALAFMFCRDSLYDLLSIMPTHVNHYFQLSGK